MNRRALFILAGLGVALAVILLVVRVDFDIGGEAGGLHAPGLAERLDDLESLRLIQAGNEVVATIRRSEAGWVVAEKGGYPANFERLRSSLQALAQARRVEKKTALPEFHSRLGLDGPDSPDFDGYLLQLNYGDTHEAEGYIVGRRAGSGMAYIRTEGEAQSWMVSADFDLADRTRDWLDRELIDLESSGVQRVALDRSGDLLEIAKEDSADLNFTPLDIPEGRELSYGSVANSIASALANVQAKDVRLAEEVEALPAAAQVRYETFDGLELRLDVREEAPASAQDDAEEGGEDAEADADPRYWVIFTAAALGPPEGAAAEAGAAPATAAEPGEAAEDEAPAGEASADEQAADDEQLANEEEEATDAEATAGLDQNAEPEAPPPPTPAERAAELNARLGGWAYELPAYKSDQWFKTMDDLLKDE